MIILNNKSKIKIILNNKINLHQWQLVKIFLKKKIYKNMQMKIYFNLKKTIYIMIGVKCLEL